LEKKKKKKQKQNKTGEFCSLYDFTKPEIQQLLNSGELFQKMKYFVSEE